MTNEDAACPQAHLQQKLQQPPVDMEERGAVTAGGLPISPTLSSNPIGKIPADCTRDRLCGTHTAVHGSAGGGQGQQGCARRQATTTGCSSGVQALEEVLEGDALHGYHLAELAEEVHDVQHGGHVVGLVSRLQGRQRHICTACALPVGPAAVSLLHAMYACGKHLGRQGWDWAPPV